MLLGMKIEKQILPGGGNRDRTPDPDLLALSDRNRPGRVKRPGGLP